MSIQQLHTILHPESIVVAGASNNPSKMGTVQSFNITGNGFRGEVVFLHPRETTILGRPSYADPLDLPFVPDLAVLITPSRVTPGLLDRLGQRGVRHAVVTTAGFRELGDGGEDLHQQLMEAAHRHGIRFVGPNCIGILNTHHPLNTTILPQLTRPGPLSIVSQSGTFIAQLPAMLAANGVRLGKGISVGNSADTDLTDWLEYLGQDPLTKAVILYIEGMPDVRRFLKVASAVTRIKPVVAVYTGGTEAGARAGMSHTASLGGASAVMDGVFAQAGVLRAHSVEEMIDWGWALAVSPRPAGNRVGILTNSGGPSTCMADEAQRQGLRVPEFSQSLQEQLQPHLPPHAPRLNPVDLTFFLDHHVFTEVVPRIMLASGEIDLLLVHGIMDTGLLEPLLLSLGDKLPFPKEAVLEGFKADLTAFLALLQQYQVPAIATTYVWDDHAAQILRDNDVPLLPCPHRAARTAAALVRYVGIAGRPESHAPDGDPEGALDALCARIATLPSGLCSERVSTEILSRAGIPFPPTHVAGTADEACRIALELGVPIALKGISKEIAHKTEAGLVALDLRTEAEIRSAFSRMEGRCPEGCQIAPMIRGRRELVMGILRRPDTGPVVMVGSGGVFAETLRDVSFRLPPLTRTDAETMLSELRIGPVFGAVRGFAGLNMDQFFHIAAILSSLALRVPRIAEIDINPIIVGEDGSLTAVDALVVLRDNLV
jgi:acetyltransferase